MLRLLVPCLLVLAVVCAVSGVAPARAGVNVTTLEYTVDPTGDEPEFSMPVRVK